eukprot:scaffold429910_cov33-Prasinocladus_malaysianus.AAC.1
MYLSKTATAPSLTGPTSCCVSCCCGAASYPWGPLSPWAICARESSQCFNPAPPMCHRATRG